MDEKQIEALFEASELFEDLNPTRYSNGDYASSETRASYRGFLACYQHLAPQLKDAERYRFIRSDEIPSGGGLPLVVRKGLSPNARLLVEERLDEIVDSALKRMDTARRILTDGNPRPECNWGVLDTSDLRRALSGAATVAEPQPKSDAHNRPR